MRYGVVINLDYETFTHEHLKILFHEIREAFLENGFTINGRIFVIDMPAEEGSEVARRLMDTVAEEFMLRGEDAYSYVKEFVGFQFGESSNLLLPSSDEIDVEEFTDLDSLEGVDLVNLRKQDADKS